MVPYTVLWIDVTTVINYQVYEPFSLLMAAKAQKKIPGFFV